MYEIIHTLCFTLGLGMNLVIANNALSLQDENIHGISFSDQVIKYQRNMIFEYQLYELPLRDFSKYNSNIMVYNNIVYNNNIAISEIVGIKIQ